MGHIFRALRWSLIVAALVSPPGLPLNGQEKSETLQYTIRAVPGDLQVDRMPGPQPPRSYQEKFTFTVSNPTRTDYAGTAPSCKTFDVVVMPSAPSGQTPVWAASNGMAFCQMVTRVGIAAGQSWQKTAVWKFTTSDVKDGKYKAIATFIATKTSTATVEFNITSVQ
jgi:hypothetical protein